MNKKFVGASIGFLIGLILGFLSYISVAFSHGDGYIPAVILWLGIIGGCTIWGYKEGKSFSK